MAGIGFRLVKLLRSDDVYQKLGGAVASIFLSSGPWLCTILSIAMISIISSPNIDPIEHQKFRIIINYTYVCSLVLFSLLEMVTTRYLADAIYLRQEKVIPTLYCWLVAGLLAVTTLIAGVFYSIANLDWKIVAVSCLLLSSVTLIWCAMIFLSACKDYAQITFAFVIGMVTSVAGSWFLGAYLELGMMGQLLGFTLGQVIIATLLSYRVFSEFGIGFLNPSDYLQYYSHKRVFTFVGLFYALAIWTDKVIFWLSPQTSERVAYLFYKSSAYDTGIFLAYLSVVPSTAFFLVQMETRFYLGYRKYLSLMDNKAPLRLIEKRRVEIIEILRSDVVRLLVFQSFLTIPALVLAPEILQELNLPIIYSTVVRYGLIGSALHIFLLFCNIIILYFDLPWVVIKNYLAFLILNTVFSLITTFMDSRFHGLGYATASLVALIISVISLNSVLKQATFLIFIRQPLSPPSSRPIEFDRVSLK